MVVGCTIEQEPYNVPKVDTVCLPLLDQWVCGVTENNAFNPIINHSEIKP